MSFRPFAQYFVKGSFEKWAASKDQSEVERIRSHCDFPPIYLHEDTPEAYQNWRLQLDHMRAKIRQQRVQIAYRDEAYQNTLRNDQNVKELRGLMRRRYKRAQADHYRQLVDCTPSRCASHTPSAVARTPRSAVFLTLPQEEVVSLLRRNPTPTPSLPPFLDTTPCRPKVDTRRRQLR
jgi:hypothetical protein